MKIYITYLNFGYEGKSEPLAAFSAPDLAKVFMTGAELSFGTSVEIKELELIESITKEPNE